MKHVVSVLLLLMALLVFGCQAESTSQEAVKTKTPKKETSVEVVSAREQPITKSLETIGELVATNSITIRSSVEGPVSWCPWREGDHVKKGERLVVINRPLYRAEVQGSEAALAVARARLADMLAGPRKEEIAQAAETVRELEACAEFARTDLARVQQLVASSGLPEEALDKARLASVKCETKLSAAREKYKMLKAGPTRTDIAVQKALVQEALAKRDIARAKLDESIIVAPFDGIVTRVDIRPGDLAQARTPLLALMEKSSVVLRFGVPESDMSALTDKATVRVVLGALPGRTYTARIQRLFPQIDEQTRTRTVEARLETTDDLVPGMFARVRLGIGGSQRGVVVPDQALLTKTNGQTVVFVVNNGKAEQRIVRTGIENGSCIQILEGVNPDERVIVAGHEKLQSGHPVRATESPKALHCFNRALGDSPA
jgi:membrane fusion protein (multidrug efflux system)